MTILNRVAREPNALLGVVVALYGILVAFHVLVLNAQQVGAVTAFGGALVIALRWITTPSSEVVAQKKPGESVVAGPAAEINNGLPVQVTAVGPQPPHGA